MGALSDTLKPRYQGCRFGELIDAHADDDDRAVIDNGDVTNAEIHGFVTANWGPVSKTVLAEHRRGVCSCARGEMLLNADGKLTVGGR